MAMITYFDAADMQRDVEEKFGVHIHIHDTCGGLYFSFDDEPSRDILEYVRKYWANHTKGSWRIMLTPDNLNFSLSDNNAVSRSEI